MKKIILFLILLYVPNYLYSQSSGLRGSVRDSASGETVPYATVRILGTDKGAYSNVNGYYFISTVPFGYQDVQVTAVGYEPLTKRIRFRREEPVSQNFYIVPKPVQLQPITKTAERLKEVYETNISAQSISQQEINMVPVTVQKDLFRVIKLIPGVVSTSDVTSQFYVRGGGGDQNLILLDNMIVYNPFHAFGLFSIFNSDIIKVSEVLTGGFGPEFGGRLSSVINIMTREGNKNRYAGKVNLGLLSGQACVEGPVFDGSFLLSYRRSYFDQILKKFLSKDLPVDFYDLNGKVMYDLSEDGKFYGNFFVSNDHLKNDKLTEPDYDWKNNAFSLQYLQSLGDIFMLDATFSRSFFSAYMDPKGYQNKIKSESQISNALFNAKVEAFLKSGDIVTFGFTFDLPDMKYALTNSAGYNIDGSGHISDASIWVKYKLTKLGNFTFDIGLRGNLSNILDQPDYFLEPRLSMKYNIDDNFAIKGSYGRYHQKLITTSNEDEVIPVFETWLPINIPLNPERADHFVLGIDGNATKNLVVSLQGYYKKFNNILGYNLYKYDADDPDFASGHGKSYGVETMLKYQRDGLFSWISYSLSWAEKTINNITYPPRYDKRHVLNILCGYNITSDFSVTFNWEYNSGSPFTQIVGFMDKDGLSSIFTGGYHVNDGTVFPILGDKNGARLPAYHRLDMTISKSYDLSQTTKLSIDFNIINLYDNKNIFYYNRDTGERINMLPFMPSFSIGVEF
jgi:outer membrane cobalamin receptor